MDIKRAVKIFKNLYSTDYEEPEKMEAIKIISNNWSSVFRKITKGDLLRAVEYTMDILGK